MKSSTILIEAAAGNPKGGRWLVRVISAGLSGNGRFYPPAVLREAVPLFDGARVFVKSDEEHLAGKGKDVRNLIGRLSEPTFAESGNAGAGEIRAVLSLIEPDGPIGTKIREAWSRGMTDLFGLSIDATGKAEPARMGGRAVQKIVKIGGVQSVDLIVEPGAGGQLINLIESQRKGPSMDENEGLTAEQIELRLLKSGLSQASQQRVTKLLEALGAEKVTEAMLREAIENEKAAVKEIREALAKATDSGKVTGLGEDMHTRVELIEGRPQKVAKMLDAFFDPKDSSVVSIRECYLEITGDKRFTGMIRECDQVRLRESLGSASFDYVLGDAVTRRMVADYRNPNIYDAWRAVASTVPINDFRVQHRVRFGGYGDLPIVAERGPYAALASPTDEEATYQPAKRGGTEDVTLEMIANDDVAAVQRIPIKLARAAKRTLAKFVLDFIRANPVIYDGLALFHATHGNLSLAALDGTSLPAARLSMMKQTELNSADRIGIGPRSLLVPPDLEETAVDLFRRNTNNDKSFVQSLTLDVVPVWYWTDSKSWAIAADPMDIPTIEVGFFQGREEPELFVQDNPSVGSMFANDVITYKIRHIYGAAVVDYRGLHKAVVP